MTAKTPLRKVNELLRPFRKVIATIALLLFVGQLLNLAYTYIVSKIISGYPQKLPIWTGVRWAALGYLVFSIRNHVTRRREDFEIKRFEHAVPLYLSKLAMDHLFDWSIAQHRRHHSGLIKSIVVEGEQSFMQIAHMMTYEIFEVISQMMLTISLVFFVSPWFGCIVLGVAVAVSLTSYWINMHVRPDILKYEKDKQVVAKAYSEVYDNIPFILVQAQEMREKAFCMHIHAELRAFGQRIWRWVCTASEVRNHELGFPEAAVAVFGYYLVDRRHYDAGTMVMLFLWSQQLFTKMYNVGPIVRKAYKLWPAVIEYLALLDVEPELKHDPHPIRPAVIRGKIAAKHVTFWHGKEDESDPNLVDINFSIEPGERIGIVGGSGSGKSTLVSLLFRITDPNEGSILVDDVDLRRYDLTQYRRSIGFVEQHVPILDRTLRQNILIGVDSSTVSQGWLEEVSRLARIDEFLGGLKGGFDTMLGDRGVRLSGGQCQRVGIARALVKNPSILIFDEATSNLDSENEALVHDAIDRVSKGKTTIIIAHRLSTVKDCDRILMIENGRLVAEGDHAKLMRISSAYSTLVQRQLVQ
jgi:ABC-type multidrug transport system fused ATPase/permease subunit